MAMMVKEIKDWLESLDNGDFVGINDGGLCLEAVGDRNIYLEIGGIPQDEEGEE